MEKRPFLHAKHGLTPLENLNFSIVWSSCVYSLERRFFVLEYRKTHFPGLYLKKNHGKMAIFGPKPLVNCFGKILVFRLVELFLYCLEKGFLVVEYRNTHFSGLYCLKRKDRNKCSFWTKTMG